MRDTIMGNMWNDLYRVDWHSLMHAYGKARDVPQMLRDIVHPDADIRGGGWDAFWNAVNHQSDFYDSTVAAMPFLTEAVAQPGLPGRTAVLDYFRERWSDMPLHGGDPLVLDPPGGIDIPTPMLSPEEAAHRAATDPASEIAEQGDDGEDGDAEEEDECDISSCRRMDLCAWQAGRAILAARATFEALLAGPDREVAAAAAFLLLTWRDTRPAAKRTLLRMIAEEPRAEKQARFILELGVYAAHDDKTHLTMWLAPERPAPIRAAAALVWAWLIEPEPLPEPVAAALGAATLPNATGFGSLTQVGAYRKGLWELPSNAAVYVLRLMESLDNAVRWRAVQALAHHRPTSRYISDAEAVPVLLKCLADDYNRIRTAAAQALAERGDTVLDVAPDAVPVLIAALDDHKSRDWGDSVPSLDLQASANGHVARLLGACAYRLSPGQRREVIAAIDGALERVAGQENALVWFAGLGVPAAAFMKKQRTLVEAAQPWTLADLFAEYFLSGLNSDTTLSPAACDRALADAYARASEEVLDEAVRAMTGTENRHGAIGAALWLTTLGPAAEPALEAVERMAAGPLDSYATGQAHEAGAFIRQTLMVWPQSETPSAGDSLSTARHHVAGLQRAAENRSAVQDGAPLIEGLANGLVHDDPYVRAAAAAGFAPLALVLSSQTGSAIASLRRMLDDEAATDIGIAASYACHGRLYQWRQERRSPRASAIAALLALKAMPEGDPMLRAMLAEARCARIKCGKDAEPQHFPLEQWRAAVEAAGGLSTAGPLIRAVQQSCHGEAWKGSYGPSVCAQELAHVIRRLDGRLTP